MAFGKYGKDRGQGNDAYISGALSGHGRGPSEGIVDHPIDRPHQEIKRAFALDNVDLAMPIETAMREEGDFHGDVRNLKHSLTGTSAVNEEVGADGPLKHVILPGH